MKKLAFTLSEILISLGIIGIVSALTLPTLVTSTKTAQVGPKLAKVSAMVEQANINILNSSSADSILDAGIDNTNLYTANLINQLKISAYNGEAYNIAADSGVPAININRNTGWISKDGIVYSFIIDNNNPPQGAASLQRIGYVIIDINGVTPPNIIASDIFGFSLMNSGALKPIGGSGWQTGGNDPLWSDNCDNRPIANRRYTCTASIFANGLKINYQR